MTPRSSVRTQRRGLSRPHAGQRGARALPQPPQNREREMYDFRDAHTATDHFLVNPATWELTGHLLLDQPTETAMP